ncbi:RsmB/NOP family class I SAM-dependent RNA methyltransferase [Elioraea rosea]|uniref:RsmB/NOP family class I SAM-dependent RNA methyltransferase n=1 Tax=Elioraea rosea TaxID=2492390 RepID=UPI0011822376|nr:RsmB/NOP family class I SAM-dependent RNA methyltransferase [Elioraea rosea]
MTPPARVQAGIDLLEATAAAPRAPADSVANSYFRARRYIGGGDRRAIADRHWAMLRNEARLAWALKRVRAPITSRTLMLAQLVAEGTGADAIAGLFSGAQHGPSPLADAERRALHALAELGRDAAMPAEVRFGVPSWLLPRLEARFGAALEAEMAAMDAPAPTDLRANLLKSTREEARAALAAEGIEAEPTRFSPWGLRLEGRRPVTATAAFRDGIVEIQDEGSQLIALLVDARPGMRVVDYCAGAAGKTLALAATMGNRGRLVACDVSAQRLDAAVKRLRRAGVGNVERRLLGPGERWTKRSAEAFDRVLVDAPCTGTGTWRRNPDARTRLREEDLSELVAKQAAIIDRASRLVKPGGLLVYATCSLLSEENEAQVMAFCGRNGGFGVVPLEEAWKTVADGVPPCDGNFLSLTPARHGTDGFFAAVLRRSSGAPPPADGGAA